MKYLLDSDTIIFYLRGRKELVERLVRTPPYTLASSIICVAELYYGAAKSRHVSRHLKQLDDFKQLLTVIRLDEAEAIIFGNIKAQLERSGQRLPDADLWIAATALSHDLTLVTHNSRHFARVPWLELQDWLSDS